jgi:ubiquinone/menaquinone biosynthesis C-methylase UbiE
MKSRGERKPYNIPLPTRLVNAIKDGSAKNILDVGCGYGRACFFLNENGFSVVGIDVDRVQIRLAMEEAKSRGLREEIGFILGDAKNLCFPGSSFDAATMLGVLTLVSKSERLRIVNEVHRILKEHGYIFVEEFGRTWENPVYAKRYRDDVKVTGELGTFTVKDETGRILHFSHHFTRKEILNVLQNFHVIGFEEDTFTSYYHKNWAKGFIILAQKKNGLDSVNQRARR